MAFIIAAGVRFAVKGVQSGIQAHKDFKSDRPPEAPRDRWGNPKERHLVYGLVMKAEGKINGGKGKAREVESDPQPEVGDSSTETRQLNKEEYESENYGPQTYRSKEIPVTAAPPSYEAAVSTPSQDLGPAGFGFAPTASAATGRPSSRGVSTPSEVARSTKPQRKSSTSSTSSSESDSDDSDSDTEDTERRDKPARPLISDARSPSYTTRKQQKLERRVARAQRRLERATRRAGRNAERGRDRERDARKVRKTEWKLENAERRLAGSST